MIVAALGVAEEMLGALGHPFDRTLEALRRHRRKRVFAIGKQLGAEAAADIGRDDAQLFGRDLEHRLAQHVAHEMRALAAEGQRQPVGGRIIFGDHRAGIEKIGDETLVDDAKRNRVRGRCKGARGLLLVAERRFESDIAGMVRPHRRRAGL